MKNILKLCFAAVAVAVGTGVTSCSDDEFTPSIFETNAAIDILDRHSYTFPLDTFCKKEFLEPYNLKYIYKFEDKGSDMNKNLTPPDYDKSVDLAVLTKYLWYDVYKELAGDVFLKLYSPRVIHVCGSKNYNPSQGTETLGDASNGIKINLYNANNLDPTDVDDMNHYFFKTMHHEFTHILDQTYLRPNSFNTISNNQYDASGWADAPDSLKAGMGFSSSYASSAAGEDWAETMANYVTMDTIQWAQLLQSATYEWEEVDCESRKDYNELLTPGCSLDTIGYFKESANGEHKIYRRKCVRDANGHVALDENGQVVWLHESGVDGRATILRKVDIVREYLRTNYGISLDALRREVQTRTYLTDEEGNFVKDKYGKLINRLMTVDEDNVTLLDNLRHEVYKFKDLQQQ